MGECEEYGCCGMGNCKGRLLLEIGVGGKGVPIFSIAWGTRGLLGSPLTVSFLSPSRDFGIDLRGFPAGHFLPSRLFFSCTHL